MKNNLTDSLIGGGAGTAGPAGSASSSLSGSP